MNTAIIFGGSRGIGDIIANHFKQKKISMTICARDTNGLVADDFINLFKCDVGNLEEVKQAFVSHGSKFGSMPDFVVNAAGVQGELGPSWEIDERQFEETLKINLVGSYNVARTAIRCLIEDEKQGSIIMFSGGGSCYARPNFCSYGVSKTGVLRLVETIAEELRMSGNEKIIINAIAPGGVKTKMTEEVLAAKEKAGSKAFKEAEKTYSEGGTRPEEITNLVDFLCDFERNMKISGRLIHVREDYNEFVNGDLANKEENGKLRRINLI